jgi:hypothetical protein
MQFQVGDRVQWVRAVPDTKLKGAAGVILAVIEADKRPDEYNLYDIRFEFGMYTLYGTQLDVVSNLSH